MAGNLPGMLFGLASSRFQQKFICIFKVERERAISIETGKSVTGRLYFRSAVNLEIWHGFPTSETNYYPSLGRHTFGFQCGIFFCLFHFGTLGKRAHNLDSPFAGCRGH